MFGGVGAAVLLEFRVVHGQSRTPPFTGGLWLFSCGAVAQRVGARVQLKAIAGANHFLIFSERDQVNASLGAWLRAND